MGQPPPARLGAYGYAVRGREVRAEAGRLKPAPARPSRRSAPRSRRKHKIRPILWALSCIFRTIAAPTTRLGQHREHPAPRSRPGRRQLASTGGKVGVDPLGFKSRICWRGILNRASELMALVQLSRFPPARHQLANPPFGIWWLTPLLLPSTFAPWAPSHSTPTASSNA